MRQMTPEERKFIIKLDLIVVPYAVLAYWVKYIGSTPSFPGWNQHVEKLTSPVA